MSQYMFVKTTKQCVISFGYQGFGVVLNFIYAAPRECIRILEIVNEYAIT